MRYYFCSFLLLVCVHVNAQSPPALEKIISIHMDAARLDDALEAIAQSASAKISYNASIIDESKTVTVHVQQRPVREALSVALGKGHTYKQRGQTIIVQKIPAEKKMVVAGYVRGADGTPLANATVFDKNTLESSTTNAYGYYEMRIEPKGAPLELQVSKQHFRDTLIALAPTTAALANATIAPEQRDTTLAHIAHTVRDSTKAYYAAFKDFLFTDHAELVNVDDTLYRHFQFSFLPFVGTNHRMSGNVITDISLNILGGYNRGVKSLEIGAFANLNRGDVSYVQVAGFANANGGNTEGVQAAGFANFVRGNVHGVQLAGHTNIVQGNVQGAQISGFANVNRGSIDGVQIAGFANVNNGATKAAHIAGFANVNAHDVKGIQVAGFANVAAHKMDGPQIAGFANVAADTLTGIQISGFANVAARNASGMQLGVFNYARHARVQVGCFNVADSVSGVPIGLLSFVNKGYHKLEIGTDDQWDVTLAYRTGVPAFYNIVLAGMDVKPVNDTVRWTFGYGVGTAPRLSKRWRMNFDLTAQQVVPGNVRSEWNMLNKLTVGAEWQFARRLALAGGISLNGYIYEPNTYPLLSEANAVSTLSNYNLGSDVRMKTWIGWKIALRFF